MRLKKAKQWLLCDGIMDGLSAPVLSSFTQEWLSQICITSQSQSWATLTLPCH